MVVILKFHVPLTDSALGSALKLRDGTAVELESLVPSGAVSTPFFWIHSSDPGPIVDALGERPSVGSVELVETVDDATLIGLEWDPDADTLFHAINACDGHILRAVSREGRWEFTVRFPEHDRLSAFRRHCEAVDVSLSIRRIYHRSDHLVNPGFGLTESQREALLLAVERGYYAIPRQCTTAELADELGISAQAVTERLRQAVVNVTEHTLLATDELER